MASKKIKKEKKEKKVEGKEVSLSRRFLSYIIDWYVGALAVSLPISIISQKLNGTMLKQDIMNFPKPYGMIGGILGLVFAFLYFVVVPACVWKGQTFGKHVCAIKMVTVDDQDVSFMNLILRQVVGIIIIEGALVSASAIWHQIVTMLTGVDIVTPLMYVGFVIGGASALLVGFKKDHRAIHDYIGKTKVVMCE